MGSPEPSKECTALASKKALTSVQEEELVEDYVDGWTVKELTIIYRVSERTVYRILAAHGAPKKNRRKKLPRKRKVPEPVELKPCGTNAAYQRHRRNKEYPCTPCLEAHAADVKEAKGKK